MSEYKKMDIDLELINDFVEEALGHLDQIEADCLVWVSSGVNAEIYNRLFRSLHTIKGLAGFVDQAEVLQLAHLTETALDCCRHGVIIASAEMTTVLLDSVDFIRKMCIYLTSGIKERPDSESLMTNLIDWLRRHNGTCLEDTLVSTTDCHTGSQTQVEEEQGTTPVKAPQSSSIRVPAARIDGLVDMMGELLIIQSVLEQHVRARFDANEPIMQDLNRLTKLTKSIQGAAMAMRMVSLKSTFQKALRVGQDAMLQLQRSTQINVWGEETEIDRSVAERLIEPLLHLVRNALAHGVEETEQRKAIGKPAQSTVEIGAYSKRGYVYIEVSDDGRGVDPDRVYQKALHKGLAEAGKQYSQEDIFEFLFTPGFSTSESVDTISGRGVGLDVVRSEIARLGGKVDIRSKIDQGTTFTLKIPINLAILNGTIIKIAERQYIVPTLSIKQIIKPERDQWVNIGGSRAMLRLRNEVIPLVYIDTLLGEDARVEEAQLIVVLEVENQLRAISVTEVVDRRDIVVKPLGEEFRGLNYAAGASILGDGTVSLILDVEYLVRLGGK